MLYNILWFLNFKIKYEKLMQYHSVLIDLLFTLSFSFLKFHCLHIRGRTDFAIDVHFCSLNVSIIFDCLCLKSLYGFLDNID